MDVQTSPDLPSSMRQLLLTQAFLVSSTFLFREIAALIMMDSSRSTNILEKAERIDIDSSS